MAVRILTFTLALLCTFQLQATHLQGSHISYKYLGNDQYELIFTFYRDCRGVGMSNPSAQSSLYCKDNNQTANLSLSLRSIEDITPLHDTATAGCYPQNTVATGDGIEKIIYVDTVDLNDAAYSFLKSCCEIIIQSGQCCRPSAINTGAANQNHFNMTTIFYCKEKENSSPDVTVDLFPALCCNQPAYVNLGITDTIDGDSLSFQWGHPLSSRVTNLGYTGTNYAYNHPFQAYYPGSLQPPYNNPGASPPIGIFLDPEFGDIIYTPTRCDEVTTVVLEVNEWRKDSTGNYVKISTFRYDNVFRTKECNNNNPPIIENTQTSFQICPGETICFNITTDDKTYVPPPPNPVPPADTVSLIWNSGVPNGTFTIIDTTALHQTGRFCWDTDSTDARSYPYFFVVTAFDNAYPINAVSSKSFRVRVAFPPAPVLTRSGDTIFSSVKNVTWYRNGALVSTAGSDTLIMDSIGVYSAKAIDNNGCESELSNEISRTLGIGGIDQGVFKIYPNPTHGEVVIKLFSKMEVKEIMVYDMAGRSIHAGITRHGQEIAIDWHDSNGLYIIQLHTSEGVYYQKILKLAD